MDYILEKISKMRLERGWSEYQLSEKAELPQSTISSWYRKNMTPSVASLQKICNAFGITLSQLFSKDNKSVELTDSQIKLLQSWARLSPEQQDAVFNIIDKM